MRPRRGGALCCGLSNGTGWSGLGPWAGNLRGRPTQSSGSCWPGSHSQLAGAMLGVQTPPVTTPPTLTTPGSDPEFPLSPRVFTRAPTTPGCPASTRTSRRVKEARTGFPALKAASPKSSEGSAAFGRAPRAGWGNFYSARVSVPASGFPSAHSVDPPQRAYGTRSQSRQPPARWDCRVLREGRPRAQRTCKSPGINPPPQPPTQVVTTVETQPARSASQRVPEDHRSHQELSLQV